MVLNTGAPPVLSVSDLVKRYRTGTVANDGISFSLHPGEIYGLLGPNGAGKTTLVRQVLGVLRPTAGTITLAGRDVVADPGFARKNVGFLPQGQFDLLTLRVGELIEFSARLRGMDPRSARVRRDELIGQLDLGQFASTSMHAAGYGDWQDSLRQSRLRRACSCSMSQRTTLTRSAASCSGTPWANSVSKVRPCFL